MGAWFYLAVAVVVQSSPGQSTRATSASDDLQSVVRIYIDGRQGPQMGAGFFIDCHTVATAYHVIQGANRLGVFGDRGFYPNAQILAFDPVWDLALLGVGDPSPVIPAEAAKPCPRLAVLDQSPQRLTRQQGIAVGHPDGKLNFQVQVAFNVDSPISAGKYFGPGGEEIFASPDVQLIAIDATLQPGMSGGPVIVNGVAIGVVSGSQASGGRTFGWAIPTFRFQRLQRLAAPSTNFASLPPVQLLKNARGSPLLKVTRFPQAPLDFAGLGAMVTIVEDTVAAAGNAQTALKNFASLNAQNPQMASPETAVAALDRLLSATQIFREAGQRQCNEWTVFAQSVERTYRQLSEDAKARVQLPIQPLAERIGRAKEKCDAFAEQISRSFGPMRGSKTIARLRSGAIRRWNDDVTRALLEVSLSVSEAWDIFLEIMREILPSLQLMVPIYKRLIEVAQYEKQPAEGILR